MIDLDRPQKIGVYESMAPCMYHFCQHCLLVGQTGSGKSELLKSLIAYVVAARHPMIGLDYADGATLGDFDQHFMHPVATTLDETADVFARVGRVLKYRQRELRRLRKTVRPRPKTYPGEKLFVFADEVPTLIGEAPAAMVTRWKSFLQRSRKCEVWWVCTAQDNTKADLGSTEWRAQFKAIIGMRLDEHMNRQLWGDSRDQGWSSTDLGAGEFLLKDARHIRPSKSKAAMLTDTALDALDDLFPNAAQLGEESAAAWAGDGDDLDEDDDSSTLEVPAPPPVTRGRRRDAVERDEKVMAYFDAGWTAKQIKKELRDEASVMNSITRLVKAERLEKVGYGDYRPVGNTGQPAILTDRLVDQLPSVGVRAQAVP